MIPLPPEVLPHLSPLLLLRQAWHHRHRRGMRETGTNFVVDDSWCELEADVPTLFLPKRTVFKMPSAKESMRKYRENMKNNPGKYAEHQKKDMGRDRKRRDDVQKKTDLNTKSKDILQEKTRDRVRAIWFCPKNYWEKFEGHKNLGKTISWKEWINVGNHSKVVTKTMPYEGAIKELKDNMEKFKLHCFIKKVEAEYFEESKKNLKDNEAVVQIDFAENYALISQDEIQSAHWSHDQVTVFTCRIWLSTQEMKPIVIAYVSKTDVEDDELSLNNIWTHILPIPKIQSLHHFEAVNKMTISVAQTSKTATTVIKVEDLDGHAKGLELLNSNGNDKINDYNSNWGDTCNLFNIRNRNNLDDGMDLIVASQMELVFLTEVPSGLARIGIVTTTTRETAIINFLYSERMPVQLRNSITASLLRRGKALAKLTCSNQATLYFYRQLPQLAKVTWRGNQSAVSTDVGCQPASRVLHCWILAVADFPYTGHFSRRSFYHRELRHSFTQLQLHSRPEGLS
ncbi:hypothetical protein PR048_020595 [Dryococelus australis]|uniref:Uncharacterized protein n=1 Tax=Dryococelus australis TaxID=614101 RepID=A0ABQ9H6S3_9NEOP|nr:hypothetical protein PR048_020595 [Dryococelus australis]